MEESRTPLPHESRKSHLREIPAASGRYGGESRSGWAGRVSWYPPTVLRTRHLHVGSCQLGSSPLWRLVGVPTPARRAGGDRSPRLRQPVPGLGSRSFSMVVMRSSSKVGAVLGPPTIRWPHLDPSSPVIVPILSLQRGHLSRNGIDPVRDGQARDPSGPPGARWTSRTSGCRGASGMP